MVKGRGRREEVEKIVADFERSGLNRGEYCERSGLARPALDWYRRRVGAGCSATALVPVRIKNTAAPMVGNAGDGFSLTLVNGQRIEAGWDFDEGQLARLIRIAGTA